MKHLWIHAKNEIRIQTRRRTFFVSVLILFGLLIYKCIILPLNILHIQENSTIDMFSLESGFLGMATDLTYVIVIMCSMRLVSDKANGCMGIIDCTSTERRSYYLGKALGNIILFSVISVLYNIMIYSIKVPVLLSLGVKYVDYWSALQRTLVIASGFLTGFIPAMLYAVGIPFALGAFIKNKYTPMITVVLLYLLNPLINMLFVDVLKFEPFYYLYWNYGFTKFQSYRSAIVGPMYRNNLTGTYAETVERLLLKYNTSLLKAIISYVIIIAIIAALTYFGVRKFSKDKDI